ncbi:MAG TPA: PEP-CTERM sorting domain-containing protein [Crinalium sp.]
MMFVRQIASHLPQTLLLSIVPIAAVGLSLSPAQAAQLTLTNSSFDQGVTLNPGGVSGIITGWTIGANTSSGVYYPVASDFTPSLSPNDYVAFINRGSISQTLSDTLLADTTYTLNLNVGWRSVFRPVDYSVQLLAGSTLLAEDNLTNLLQREGLTTSAISSGRFFLSSLTFTSTQSTLGIGQPLTIRLSSSGIQTNFNNLTLLAVSQTPTPTPTPTPNPTPTPTPTPTPEPTPSPTPTPEPTPSPTPTPEPTPFPTPTPEPTPSPTPTPEPTPSPTPTPEPTPSPTPTPEPTPSPTPTPEPTPSPTPTPDPTPSPTPTPDPTPSPTPEPTPSPTSTPDPTPTPSPWPTPSPTPPASVPEPSSVLGLLTLGALGTRYLLKRPRKSDSDSEE